MSLPSFPRPLFGISLLTVSTLLGCGGEVPQPAPESPPANVDLGAPAESMEAAADPAPVLPIPEDAPGAETTVPAPEIKPIPDEPVPESKPAGEAPNQ